MSQRLLVISACCQCPYSKDSSACFHVDVPGRTDEHGDAPKNDGSGHTYQCSRALPKVPKGVGGFPEYQSPPDWCPLPKVMATEGT